MFKNKKYTPRSKNIHRQLTSLFLIKFSKPKNPKYNQERFQAFPQKNLVSRCTRRKNFANVNVNDNYL